MRLRIGHSVNERFGHLTRRIGKWAKRYSGHLNLFVEGVNCDVFVGEAIWPPEFVVIVAVV